MQELNRRDFLATAMAGAAWLPAAGLLPRPAPQGGKPTPESGPNAYKYRIAFGAWINDMRREFIRRLPCAYGTSGRLWLYPDARWDRSSYFLPYVKRAGEALQAQFADGVRGCLFYQGPVSNPGTEVNIPVGGRALADARRSVADTLAEVIELYYRPKTAETRRQLVDIFLRAEEAYFGNWPRQRELFLKLYGFVPGEFKLDQNLWGTSPGPATFLKEPMLDAAGRQDYKKGLVSILRELPALEGRCDDRGRLARIKRAVIFTLNLINTIG